MQHHPSHVQGSLYQMGLTYPVDRGIATTKATAVLVEGGATIVTGLGRRAHMQRVSSEVPPLSQLALGYSGCLSTALHSRKAT